MDSAHLDKRHEKFCDDAETRSRSAAGLDRREFMAAAGATAVVAAAGLAATEAEAAFSDRVAGITQDEPMEIIGTGVSAQERFFRKFEEMSGGLQVTGQVASLADSVQKWMTGGYETFSMIETNAFRTPALREAETIAPIPVEKITNWEFADTLFSDPAHVGADHTSGWPVEMVYWDDTRTSFGMLPQIYNMDALGILPHKFAETQTDRLTPDTLGVLYEGQWRDVDVRGKVSIQNEDLIGPPRCASYLVKNRKMDPVTVGYGDLEPDELKNVIDFLIGAKQDGVFRALWTNYGEAVNLLASEEVWGIDCWNPVIEDVKKRGIPCFYVDVWEGTGAWYYGMCLSSEAPQPEVAMAYMDWCLEGWRGAADAEQGYYSPCPDTARNYMTEEAWLKWYEGRGRDTGPKLRRQSNIAYWMIWPRQITLFIKEWNRFLAA